MMTSSIWAHVEEKSRKESTVKQTNASLEIGYEQAILKVGVQDQVSGKLTISETEHAMFREGEITFRIKKDNQDIGIYLEEVDLEMSNSIKGEIISDNDEDRVSIKIRRETKEKGMITFKSMTFTTDRTVPEGIYDLEIYGTGIDTYSNPLIIEDFIKVTSPVICSFPISSTTNKENNFSKVAQFVIGENKYTYQDEEITMDASTYIQAPGYTMVPIRYVAQAFGVSESDIIFGKSTITIFYGDRNISLTVGSRSAVVNGHSIDMKTEIVNKEGRIYGPASQIANLLGIQSEWDQDTQTAYFISK